MKKNERINILGMEIDNVSIDEAIEQIVAQIKEHSQPCFGVTPNVAHTNHYRKYIKYRIALSEASLIVADGVPLIWAARILGHKLKGRVNGTDLFSKIIKICAKEGFKIFLLGAMPEALDFCKINLIKKNPDLQISGSYSPPIGFDKNSNEDQKIINMIVNAKPDILFLGLPGPMAEYWIYDHYKRIGVPFSINVGASFDFVSGTVPRAPDLMQKYGLEWLFRLLTHPKKLWKRYLIGNSIFVYRILIQVIIRIKNICFVKNNLL